MTQMFRILALLGALLLLPQAAHPAEPHWPSSLTIGSASPGGTYYVYGEGLARILTRALGIAVDMRQGPRGRQGHGREAAGGRRSR